MDAASIKVVFVFGALRSGTTVFRLMLDGHPDVKNPGEVDFLFDFLRQDSDHPTGWRYDRIGLSENRVFMNSGLVLTDGLDGLDLLHDFLRQYEDRGAGVLTLNIHRNLDRALRVLPSSSVIHMLRDPRDVARSSIGMGWAGTLYYGVNHWIRTETEWDRVGHEIAPDKLQVLTYENLFRNIVDELEAVCRFLGVPFHGGMLEYHENSTYGPPDPSLVEQWRRKSSASDIALVEGKAGPLMTARGYQLSGTGRVPGSIERLKLYVVNRLGVWRTGVQIFGFTNFFLEKLARYGRMSRLHKRLQDRMREQVESFIK